MSNPIEFKNQLSLIGDILRTQMYLPKSYSSDALFKRSTRTIYEKISSRFGVVNERKTFNECFVHDEFDSFSGSPENEKLFVMNIIRREPDMLPVMGVKYKIGEEHLSLTLKAGLFKNEEYDLAAFGYRFESPSFIDHPLAAAVGNAPGSHNFFHAQPIRVFKKDIVRYQLPRCPALFTEKQPSFPLDAKCPVTLALAFLVGIYGMSCWKDIESDPTLVKRIKARLAGIHYPALSNLN